MLKGFLTKIGITGLLDKVRIAGLTIADHLKQNRVNTKASFTGLFKRAVMGDAPVEQFVEKLGTMAKTRKRQTLTTLKNIMGAVRGQARAVVVGRKAGTWHNNGILDGVTTSICRSYMFSSWDLPYSEIPEKPPRVSVTPHPCRSFLTFVKKDDPAPTRSSFMDEFNADESLQRELLGAKRFEAYKAGKLTITSFAQFERVVLTTLEDLGLQ